jgi:methylated-DNA-[protein]-cysteine S-methyltransferase
MLGYTRFDTPIGGRGLAWSERGIARIQLPEASDAHAVRRLKRNDDLTLVEPPPRIARAIEQICRHLGGDRQDFAAPRC